MGKRTMSPIALLVAGLAIAVSVSGGEEPFSFYFWSDTHFDAAGDGALRDDAVADMIGLVGRSMPAGYGTVENAAFVLHGGDVTTNARPQMWENDNPATGDDFVSCARALACPCTSYAAIMTPTAGGRASPMRSGNGTAACATPSIMEGSISWDSISPTPPPRPDRRN